MMHCDMDIRSCFVALEDSSELETERFDKRSEADRLEEGMDLASRPVDGMLMSQLVDRDMSVEDVEGLQQLNWVRKAISFAE